MAIIEEFGLGVTVKVDGQSLTEYPDPEPQLPEKADPDHTITSHHYIEAQDDKEFVVSVTSTNTWESEEPNFALTYYIYVDGKFARAKFARHGDLWWGHFKSDTDGAVEHPSGANYTLLHRFKFSSITTVDDTDKQRLEEDKRATKHLGTIQVNFFRTLEAGLPYDPTTSGPSGTSLSVAEKALKGQAISHGTSYAPPVKEYRSHCVNVTWLDPYPIAMMCFKYRSRAALQAEMIIPRPPSQTPEADEVDIDGLSVDELRRIARKRRREIKDGKQVKSEGSRVIKREFSEIVDLTDDIAGPQVRKIPRTSQAEAIDLTADSPQSSRGPSPTPFFYQLTTPEPM
ncbi:hypothetical protein GQ53DRAFT_826446 [Thozetella sp. PMI_491]|nr:hypothetical protein GQ53DRAFT_826446 [Thozetella sp. PMI_491]